MTRGVPQESVLELVLISSLITLTKGSNVPSANLHDTKLSGVIDTPEGQDALQRGLDKPEKWPMGISCGLKGPRCFTWVGETPSICLRLEDEQIESSASEKNLGVSMECPSGNQQLKITKDKSLATFLTVIENSLASDNRTPKKVCLCGQEANAIPASVRNGVASRSREVILSLYSALVKLHLEFCVQFWFSESSKDVELLEHIQKS
ncbi:hypothetical protein TURU_093119 [Turdus rufiventris]|nr:hypothetical protein TURU_093119 [Turdus rufiventris]